MNQNDYASNCHIGCLESGVTPYYIAFNHFPQSKIITGINICKQNCRTAITHYTD